MSARPIASRAAGDISSGSLSMRGNFTWILVGNVVYGTCQWGIIVAIAKLGVSWQVGQYALALAISAPVMLLANLQLRQVLATDARSTYTFGNYLSLRLLTSAGALVVTAGLVVLMGQSSETGIVVLLVATAKAIDSLSDIVFGLLQSRERMRAIGLSMASNGFGSLLASASAMYLTHSVLAVGVASAFGSAAAFLIALYGDSSLRGSRELAGDGKSSHVLRLDTPLWSLARLSLPLGAVMFLISLNANIPRYFIQRDLGAGQLGVYAAVGYALIVGMTFITSIGQAASPRLARYYAFGNRAAFVRLLRRLIFIGSLSALTAVSLTEIEGRRVVLLLYGVEYAGDLVFFRLLTVAAGLGFIASFIGYGVTAARYFSVQAPLFAGAAMVTGVGCAILVPRYGLTGAAWAVLAAAALQLVGSIGILIAALRNHNAGVSNSHWGGRSTVVADAAPRKEPCR